MQSHISNLALDIQAWINKITRNHRYRRAHKRVWRHE